MARNAQPLGDFSHGPPELGHLPHRFHLELVRLSFASHKDLLGCRKLGPQVVYKIWAVQSPPLPKSTRGRFPDCDVAHVTGVVVQTLQQIQPRTTAT
jgi:hypothetical protein